MFNKYAHYSGIVACLGIIAACFLPWTYYHSIQQTFTGFNVVPFPNATYYGKAGIPISILASLILLFRLIPRIWASRINVFLAGLLLAYVARTYIIFTSSLFKGEVEKFAGIYIVVLLSLLILISTMFPKENNKPASK